MYTQIKDILDNPQFGEEEKIILIKKITKGDVSGVFDCLFIYFDQLIKNNGINTLLTILLERADVINPFSNYLFDYLGKDNDKYNCKFNEQKAEIVLNFLIKNMLFIDIKKFFGRFLDSMGMDLLQQEKQQIIEWLKKFPSKYYENKVTNLNQEEWSLKEIQNIDLSILNDTDQLEIIKNKLINIIDKFNLSSSIKEQLKMILFDDINIILKNSNKFKVIAELLEIAQTPEIIDQRKSNLCGPASFLVCLAKDNPALLISMALKLASIGTINAPLKLTLSKNSINNVETIVEVLLTEIRRSSNILFGYSPRSGYTMGGYVPTFKSWEKFQGATNPRLICEWLKLCGYTDIQDLTFMLNKNSQPLSRLKKIPLNILFNKFHYQNTDETVPKNNIELVNILLNLQQDINNKNKSVVLFTGQHTNFIGYPFDHYVYLNKLELISDNTLVNYEIITYGKKKYCENVTLEEFKEKYRGHIVATKPNNSNRDRFYKTMAS